MQLSKPIKCSDCGDELYHTDEIIFLLGGEPVFVDEQYPDWDDAICNVCADEKGLI